MKNTHKCTNTQVIQDKIDQTIMVTTMVPSPYRTKTNLKRPRLLHKNKVTISIIKSAAIDKNDK